MNRQIKFRAWDGNFMHYEVDIVNGKHFIDGFNLESVLMQYTGLKDKNGKEIWEGDICEVHFTCHALHRDSPYRDMSVVKEGDRFIVKKLLSGFTLMDIKTGYDNDIPNLHSNINNYTFWNGHRDLIVIGNIHENPGLLNP